MNIDLNWLIILFKTRIFIFLSKNKMLELFLLNAQKIKKSQYRTFD